MNENVKNFFLTPSQEIIRTQSRSFNSRKKSCESCYGSFFPFSEIPDINIDPYINSQRRNLLTTTSAHNSSHSSTHNSTRESTRGSRKSSRNHSSAGSDVEDDSFNDKIIDNKEKGNEKELDDSPVSVDKYSFSSLFDLSIKNEFLPGEKMKYESKNAHETKNLIDFENPTSDQKKTPPSIILVALDSPKKRIYKEVDYSVIRPKPFNYRDYNRSVFADPPDDIIRSIEITKAQIKHPELMREEMTEGSIFCEICQIYFNDPEEAENHRKSEIHIKNLNNYDIDQMMSEINDFCAKIDEKRELKHQLKQQLNLNLNLNMSSDQPETPDIQSSFQSPKSEKKRRRHKSIENSPIGSEKKIEFSNETEKIDTENRKKEKIDKDDILIINHANEKLKRELLRSEMKNKEKIEKEKRELERKQKERIEREKREFQRKEEEKVENERIRKIKIIENDKIKSQNSFYENLLLLHARNQNQEENNEKVNISNQIEVKLNQIHIEKENQNKMEEITLEQQNQNESEIDKVQFQYETEENQEQNKTEINQNQNEIENNTEQIQNDTENNQNQNEIEIDKNEQDEFDKNQEQIQNETEENQEQNGTDINNEQTQNGTEIDQQNQYETNFDNQNQIEAESEQQKIQEETSNIYQQIQNESEINQEQIQNQESPEQQNEIEDHHQENDQNESEINQEQIQNQESPEQQNEIKDYHQTINQNEHEINQEQIQNQENPEQQNEDHHQTINQNESEISQQTTNDTEKDHQDYINNEPDQNEDTFNYDTIMNDLERSRKQMEIDHLINQIEETYGPQPENQTPQEIPRPDFRNLSEDMAQTGENLQFDQEENIVMPPHLSYVYRQTTHTEYNKSPQLNINPSDILSSPPRIRHKFDIYSNEGLIQPRINIDSLVQLSPHQQVVQYLRETNAMKEIIRQPSPFNSDSLKSSEIDSLSDLPESEVSSLQSEVSNLQSEADYNAQYDTEINEEADEYENFDLDTFNSDYFTSDDTQVYSTSSDFNNDDNIKKNNVDKKNEEDDNDEENNDFDKDNNYQFNQDPDIDAFFY